MTPTPKRIQLKRLSNGRIAWKSMLSAARTDDYMILPLNLRSAVHGAANASGKPVMVRMTRNRREFCATFVTPETRSRHAIMKDFSELSIDRLRALHDAAVKSCVIRP